MYKEYSTNSADPAPIRSKTGTFDQPVEDCSAAINAFNGSPSRGSNYRSHISMEAGRNGVSGPVNGQASTMQRNHQGTPIIQEAKAKWKRQARMQRGRSDLLLGFSELEG